MKRRVRAAALVLALAVCLAFVAAASGGTASDPVVSKSYVDGTFFNSVISAASEKIENAVSSFKTKYVQKAEEKASVVLSEQSFTDAVAAATLRALQSEGKYLSSSRYMEPVTLQSGDVISAQSGTMIMLTSGSASCTSGSVINITQGRTISQGSSLGQFTAFMFSESGARVEITSKEAKVLVDGRYALSEGYKVKYTDEAYALKKLGLVRGAANGMELYRGNTRAESITMLIRLLGEEEAALATDHLHPFGDVDEWAKRYVGYAYRMGYTKGVSQTRYDGSSMTTAGQYITFILRALGYSESAGDFRYETAISDAVRLGVIDSAVASELTAEPLRRDGVMHISYLAMSAKVKGSERTLLAKLVANGAVSQTAANEFLRR
ncbi:MAG: hypothetical protein IKU65_00920 [Oscillospiraceae bacterium]|nr:hypothetical protein [Oscillospiraceae bacterium]